MAPIIKSEFQRECKNRDNADKSKREETMTKSFKLGITLSRRTFGKGALAASTAVVAAGTPLRYALGADPIKIGLVLPYSGVYANFGEGITNGFEFALKKRGDQLGGRPVEIIKGDDQLDAKIGGEVTQKLVSRDNVDIVVGTVGSNVVPVMQKICIDAKKFPDFPTAASNDLTARALPSAHFQGLTFELANNGASWSLALQARQEARDYNGHELCRRPRGSRRLCRDFHCRRRRSAAIKNGPA